MLVHLQVTVSILVNILIFGYSLNNLGKSKGVVVDPGKYAPSGTR